jgi:hypothetical protein
MGGPLRAGLGLLVGAATFVAAQDGCPLLTQRTSLFGRAENL